MKMGGLCAFTNQEHAAAVNILISLYFLIEESTIVCVDFFEFFFSLC